MKVTRSLLVRIKPKVRSQQAKSKKGCPFHQKKKTLSFSTDILVQIFPWFFVWFNQLPITNYLSNLIQSSRFCRNATMMTKNAFPFKATVNKSSANHRFFSFISSSSSSSNCQVLKLSKVACLASLNNKKKDRQRKRKLSIFSAAKQRYEGTVYWGPNFSVQFVMCVRCFSSLSASV